MSAVLSTLVAFVVVTGMVLSLYYAVTAESPVSTRMRELLPAPQPAARRAHDTSAREAGVVRQLLASIGRYSFDLGATSLVHRLSVAGLRGTNAALLFLGIRTVLSVGLALLILIPPVSSGRPLGRTLAMAALAGVLAHLAANAWLRHKARVRVRQITAALPDALDLMVVCLEAGLGLSATLSRVGEERATMKDLVGREFSQVALETRNGRPREEALRALADRNGVDDLKALVGLVIHADRLGTSMAKTMRAHADLLRIRRRQRADEAARKLPVKVLFPLAFFILPALFVVTVGPALLKLGDLASLIRRG
jgi:tight adherence protein C